MAINDHILIYPIVVATALTRDYVNYNKQTYRVSACTNGNVSCERQMVREINIWV